MVYRFVALAIFITTCAYLTCHESKENSENADEEDKIHINDTVLQFFHHCTCIPYYLCSEANNFFFASRARSLPKKMYCNDKNYLCCKKIDQPEIIEATTGITTTANDTINITAATITITSATSPSEVPESTTERYMKIKKRTPFNKHQGECGMAKTEIQSRVLTPETDFVGTIPGEVPWIVEIFQKRQRGKIFKCAGSLIHPKVVVTATHCVLSSKSESLTIIATGLDNFQIVGTHLDDERSVVKIIKHPQYNSGRLINDIALLILDKRYDFSDNYLNVICLPKPNQNFDGRKCIAAGWGRNLNHNFPPPLNKVDLPIVKSSKCQDLLRQTILGTEFNLHSSLLCAGGEEGKDTCKGDGGGPLMCLSDDYQFVLTGIVSWGIDTTCGNKNLPGMYTNVAKFVDWIRNELNISGIKIKNKI